jgi:hypothetical protein
MRSLLCIVVLVEARGREMSVTLLREVTCLHPRLNWMARLEVGVILLREVTCLQPRLNWRARGREMSVTLLHEVTRLHPRLNWRPEDEK